MMKKLILLSIIFFSVYQFSFSQMICPPPPRDSVNYHGMRLNREKDLSLKDFSLVAVRTGKIFENTMTIDLIFNHGVNPRSVETKKIMINGNPIPKKTMFFFNKRGNIIRFEIKNPQPENSIKIQNISSFFGKEMVEFSLEGITENFDYRIKEK